ncbi:MAG: type II secretion system F family protein [Ilumatobacter sp.]|jgi:tight adherence protein C|uniref:type II secretion system F family protein n=1 Tax=Ilumatobacter sp. TaxID=1967498 RepID=UPI003918B3D9
MNGLHPSLVALSAVVVSGVGARRLVCGPPRPVPAWNPMRVNADTDGPVASSTHRIRMLAAVSVTLLVIVGLVVDLLLTLLGLAAAIMRRPLANLMRYRRQQAEIEQAIPDAIEQLVLVVHAGLTPHQAVRSLASTAPPATRSGFGDVVHRLDRGDALAEALVALPGRLGPSMAIVADTLAIAERHGTPIGEALVQLSADVRLRRRRLAEAEARKLPVRLSFPLVCCTLPSFVLVAIAPAVMAALSSLGDRAW